MADAQFITDRQSGLIETNKVLRNTYMLLSVTLVWSAVMAAISVAMQPPAFTGIVCTLLALVMLFVISKYRNSSTGIALVFAFTGLLGFGLGPMLSHYISAGMGSTIVTALGLTGLIFFTLSGYVLTTKKDFSFMAGFLMTGLMVVVGCAVLAMLGGFFGYHFPAFQLAISGAIVLLMSGFILFDTSRIIHGGETNYVMATVSLYLNIYNLFTALLHILGVMGDD